MATLNIVEYTKLASDGPGAQVMSGMEPNRTSQDVDISAVPNQSARFDDATRFVRVHTVDDVRIAFGLNPTAVAGQGLRMGAGSTEFFGVAPGHKLSVVME